MINRKSWSNRAVEYLDHALWSNADLVAQDLLCHDAGCPQRLVALELIHLNHLSELSFLERWSSM